LNEYLNIAALARPLLQRIFFGGVLLIFIYKFFLNLLISQIGLNPVLYQEIDPSYWLLMILKIPQLVAGNKFSAIFFDLIIILSALVSFIKPAQTWSVKIFYVFYFLYYMLFNLLAGHHFVNIGILVTAFPFMFKRNKKFALLFACSRYYFLFILTSAALWKLWRGSLFHSEQLLSILKEKNLMAIINKDTSLTAKISFFIGTREGLVLPIWIFMGVLEISFVIGFFSYRYDKLLLLNYILFAIGGFLIVDIGNFENFLMLLTLFPVVGLISRINRKLTD
jgi:hypothetical protein